MKLSNAHMRYLYTIYEISQTAPDVYSANVAKRMHVSRPSVAKMLGVLMQKGLVVKERYGEIYLTEKGSLLARNFDRTVHLLTERLPMTGLPLTKEETHQAACAIAAVLTNKNWETLQLTRRDG